MSSTTGQDQTEGAGTLSIERFGGRYLLPADHPNPERVRSRLDEAVMPALRGLASALGTQIAPARQGIWLVRRLEIELEVDLSWDSDHLARMWAARLARRLADDMHAGVGPELLHFPTQAAYLAQFLRDLVAGDAWGRWYYKPFEGLRLLPMSSTVRTALSDDPAVGLEALASMPIAGLVAVLDALTFHDARRVFEALAYGTEVDVLDCAEAVVDAWSQVPSRMLEEPAHALALYMIAWRSRPELAGPTLRAVTLALARLSRFASSGASRLPMLLATLRGGDRARLYSLVGAHDGEALVPLLHTQPSLIDTIADRVMGQQLAALTKRSDGVGASLEPDVSYTPFGGALILLPLIARLPLDELLGDWPDAAKVGAVALMRLLLLTACLGSPRADSAFSDPLLRELAGVNRNLGLGDLRDWLHTMGEQRLEGLAVQLTAWRYDDGAAGGKKLLLARTPAPGGSVAVLLDAARGLWVGIAGHRQGHRRGHTRPLTDLGPYAGLLEPDAVVYADPQLEEWAGLLFPNVQSLSAEGLPKGDLADAAARLPNLSGDLDYLLLPGKWRLSRGVRLALALIAMGVLRDFAWRLPGFARSGLPYLYRNFLDISASVEREEERNLARIGRPPLNLVLNMTGMARGTVRLNWLDLSISLEQAE